MFMGFSLVVFAEGAQLVFFFIARSKLPLSTHPWSKKGNRLVGMFQSYLESAVLHGVAFISMSR